MTRAQWFSDATPLQLRELLAHVDLMPDEMVAGYTVWACGLTVMIVPEYWD